MKIGEVASRTGLSVDTVRYYERCGVIDPPARLASGYRDYQPAVIERLLVIRRMKQLGLALNEIADVLREHDNGRATCGNQRWRLDAVIDRVDAEIEELAALRSTVVKIRAACRRGDCQLPRQEP